MAVFKVIQFKKDKSIELVPSKWIKQDKCCWPEDLASNPKIYYREVEKNKHPSSKWPSFEVEEIISSAGRNLG